jgi:hypothetical protein
MTLTLNTVPSNCVHKALTKIGHKWGDKVRFNTLMLFNKTTNLKVNTENKKSSHLKIKNILLNWKLENVLNSIIMIWWYIKTCDTVAHTCNPSSWGGKDEENRTLRLTWVKKDPISTNKPGVVVHICNPTCVKSICRRIAVWGQTWAKTQDPIHKITKEKKVRAWLKR